MNKIDEYIEEEKIEPKKKASRPRMKQSSKSNKNDLLVNVSIELNEKKRPTDLAVNV